MLLNLHVKELQGTLDACIEKEYLKQNIIIYLKNNNTLNIYGKGQIIVLDKSTYLEKKNLETYVDKYKKTFITYLE